MIVQPIGRRACLFGMAALSVACSRKGADINLRMKTEVGNIDLVLFPKKAPSTVANFMNYVDAGLYADASFYRSVRPEEDVNPVPINVIQGGLHRYTETFSPIPVETTKETGLSHTDGVISMARQVPGWPEPMATSEFFICIGDNTALDFGGARNGDGEGFAAFGQVTAGMDIVRAIHQAEFGPGGEANWVGQMLKDPVRISAVTRS